MDGFDDNAFNEFLNVVNNMPKSAYVGVITHEGVFVFNKNDKKFHSSDNKIIYDFDDKNLYVYNENINTNIMCIICFNNIDDLLDYISKGDYEKDISKILVKHQKAINNANK